MATKKNKFEKQAKQKSKSAAQATRPKVKARKGAAAPRERPREIAVFDPDAVEGVLDIMPDEDTLLAAADMLQGLAHPSRLKAVIALSVSELCVGDIAAIVGLSLSATSTMLKQLRSLGFLSIRSAGKQIYYSISSEVPSAVLQVVFAAAQGQ